MLENPGDGFVIDHKVGEPGIHFAKENRHIRKILQTWLILDAYVKMNTEWGDLDKQVEERSLRSNIHNDD